MTTPFGQSGTTGSYTVHVPKNIDGTFATDPKPAGRINTPAKSRRDALIEAAADAEYARTHSALHAQWAAADSTIRALYRVEARGWLDILEPLIRDQVAKDLEAVHQEDHGMCAKCNHEEFLPGRDDMWGEAHYPDSWPCETLRIARGES